MKTFFIMWAWMFGRPKLYKINRLLLELSLRGLGIFNYTSIVLTGEKWLLDNIVKKLGKELIVFDVGANVGSYSKAMLESGVKAANIYAFEPHPVTYLVLEGNVKISKIIVPKKEGLSDIEGELMLYDREGTEGSTHASLSMNIFSEVHEVAITERKVKINTVDNFCIQNQISKIDFLKIDVEGFEVNVLRGATAMLRSRKIRSIQFEFTQLNSIVGVFFKEIHEILADDYDIYRLLPHGLHQINEYSPTMCEIFGYQNFFAILKTEEDVWK